VKTTCAGKWEIKDIGHILEVEVKKCYISRQGSNGIPTATSCFQGLYQGLSIRLDTFEDCKMFTEAGIKRPLSLLPADYGSVALWLSGSMALTFSTLTTILNHFHDLFDTTIIFSSLHMPIPLQSCFPYLLRYKRHQLLRYQSKSLELTRITAKGYGICDIQHYPFISLCTIHLWWLNK